MAVHVTLRDRSSCANATPAMIVSPMSHPNQSIRGLNATTPAALNPCAPVIATAAAKAVALGRTMSPISRQTEIAPMTR